MKVAFWSLSTFVVLTVSAIGQETKPERSRPEPPTEPRKDASPKPAAASPDPKSNDLTSATVERIMDQAVRNIAKHYNLNPEQEKYTDELMKTRVRSFLREHESEVWPLIRDLLATQMGSNPPSDIEQVKRIGKAAKPLAKLAQKAILDANAEWRNHLTPEQKALHDFDLSEMDDVFKSINERFDAWAEGNPPPGGLFPTPTRSARPPLPSKPAPGSLPDARTEVAVKESFFDAFVKHFIIENELDSSQITSAKSILTEFKQKAQDFRTSKKDELAQIAQALQAAKAANEKDKLGEAEDARRQLLQPVYQLFDEMEERLIALLTSVQRDKYKERTASADPAKQQEAIDKELLPAPDQKPSPPAPTKAATAPSPKKEGEPNN